MKLKQDLDIKKMSRTLKIHIRVESTIDVQDTEIFY